MSDIVPMFGNSSRTSPTGQPISGSVARRSQREIELAAAHVEVEAVREQGRAFLTSQALMNVATLSSQVEAHLQTAPLGVEMYGQILHAYANSAARRIQNL